MELQDNLVRGVSIGYEVVDFCLNVREHERGGGKRGGQRERGGAGGGQEAGLH